VCVQVGHVCSNAEDWKELLPADGRQSDPVDGEDMPFCDTKAGRLAVAEARRLNSQHTAEALCRWVVQGMMLTPSSSYE